VSRPPIPLLLTGALRGFTTRYHATAIIRATAMTPPTAPPTMPPIGNGEAVAVGVGLVEVVFLISQVHKQETNSRAT